MKEFLFSIFLFTLTPGSSTEIVKICHGSLLARNEIYFVLLKLKKNKVFHRKKPGRYPFFPLF